MNNKKNKKNKKLKIFADFFLVTVGVFIMALGISAFLEPLELVTGGASGLGIIIQNLTNTFLPFSIPVWLTTSLLNIPLLLFSYKILGQKFFTKTLYATILFSVALFFTGFIPIKVTDLFIGSIFGGALMGIGLGLVFLGQSSTGGTDLIANLLHKVLPHISVSKLVFYLDALIIVLGFFIFGIEKGMYGIISIFITSKCIEAVVEGMNFSKAVFIISEKYEEISTEAMKILNRGVTGLNGKGMYTKNNSTVLLIVVSVKEMPTLRELVAKIDPNSFIIIADVREVLGEGFQNLNKT